MEGIHKFKIFTSNLGVFNREFRNCDTYEATSQLARRFFYGSHPVKLASSSSASQSHLEIARVLLNSLGYVVNIMGMLNLTNWQLVEDVAWKLRKCYGQSCYLYDLFGFSLKTSLESGEN